MSKRSFGLVMALAGALLGASIPALSDSPMKGIESEIRLSSAWVNGAFSGDTSKIREDGLSILREDGPGDTKIDKGNVGGPIRLGKKTYERGIGVNATSILQIRVSKPAAYFIADIGMDRSADGSGGSSAFHVVVNGKDVFSTGVMRPNGEVKSIKVPLNGVQEFQLVVDDGGDGRAFDQADWADARVVLQNGEERWLDKLGASRVHAELPFSFMYGGKNSSEFLKNWKVAREDKPLDGSRISHTITYTDPETGLLVRCDCIEYKDFPTVEWTLHFKNCGTNDSPVLSAISPLDITMTRTIGQEFILHHSMGSGNGLDDYRPLETALDPGTEAHYSGTNGVPTQESMPYFNVEWEGAGAIVALGWPGQWAAQFKRGTGTDLQIRGGQELTHFMLHPGEEVRTPLVTVQLYQGDWIRAQNLWRRWMLAHNVPKPGGVLPPAHWSGRSSPQYREMEHATEANQTMFIGRYLEEKMKIDNWWMDAGWYAFQGNWMNTGTWEPDPVRFPRGLRAISDYAHSKGIKTIVWFEPECVDGNTWLHDNHPEWLFGSGNGWRLFNHANPDAHKWLTDHIDKLITDQGIDVYRQDLRLAPCGDWRSNEAVDRQGITENKYVTGYLAYLDELLKRHPKMLMDMCAAGGRRNELEEMRRAVPLWRSDCVHEPISQQCFSYGMSLWIPLSGTVTAATEPYQFRSNMCSFIVSEWDMRDRKLNYNELRKLTSQWRGVAEYYRGDYYPLTPYSQDNSAWIAWQYDLPEKGEGMVQAFRRGNSPFEAARFKLRGLEPGSMYEIINVDSTASSRISGSELMRDGLPIKLAEQPSAGIVQYKKVAR